MLGNYNFKGKIDGKSISDYQCKVDLSVETSQEMIDQLYEVLNVEKVGDYEFSKDEFWLEIWDKGVCKANISTSDATWTNTNVSRSLEVMASYILNKDRRCNREIDKTYSETELKKRAEKDREKVCKIGENIDNEVIVIKSVKNYKKYKKTVVTKEDAEKYPEIRCYYDYREYLKTLFRGEEAKENRRALVEKLNKNGYPITNGKLYKFVKTTLPSVTEDMLYVKLSKIQPVKWKQPLRDSYEDFDYSTIDMFDYKQVKYSLLARRNDKIDGTLHFIVVLEDLISKTNLTENQALILDLWKKDWQLVRIAEYMDVDISYISREIDTIAKKISNTYINSYEDDYYYLNVVKGKYKTCQECGDVKLTKYFSSSNNDKKSINGVCRDCKRKIRKEKKNGKKRNGKTRFNK